MARDVRYLTKELLTLPFWLVGLVQRLVSGRAITRLYHLGRLRARIGWVSPRLQLDGPVAVEGTGNIRFGEVARLGPHVHLETNERGEIVLEEHVRLNRGITIVAYDRVRIGAHTLVGEFVTIRDANHGIAAGAHIREQAHDINAIDIGSDVWIGRGACILAGVRIGDGAVVGANSVVTADVAPGMIVGGVPARPIRERNGG